MADDAREAFDRLRDEMTRQHQEIDRRVARLEFAEEQVRQRLNTGASSFAKIEQQIEKVNAKIEYPWWRVVGALVPVILVIIAWVWQAARYPDPEKFEGLQNQVGQIKVQQIEMSKDIEFIRAQSENAEARQRSIDSKLDTMVNAIITAPEPPARPRQLPPPRTAPDTTNP